ncbi:MAG: TIGR03032 family protein [Bacteroidetes bacterium]|nr:TIGR03032 family protein [Bacteroidota bacterium]
MTNTPVSPFSCTYSSQIPELLQKLGCSLALSTYQAGKLIFLSPSGEDSLIQLPRNFEKPMGIAYDEETEKLALAGKKDVIVFRNSGELARTYPKAPGKFDSLFLPGITYHTGPLDLHDLSFGSENSLFAVNTLFSCIISLDSDNNFTPYWQPPQIDAMVSEDRCHLNGMAMENGKPRFASAFNQGNSMRSWKEEITTGGVIYDIESGETVVSNLAMPHSPRIFNNELYTLLSATGELIKVDSKAGKYEVIKKMNGFVRGMAYYKDYLFIGLSKLRKNSSSFGKLPFAEFANRSGIVVMHLPTASIAGEIIYQTSVDEIYDVCVLPDKIRPNILNTLTDDHYLGLKIPQGTFWGRTIDKD